MPKVCFKDSKFKPIDVSSDSPLLHQLQANKIPIASSCGGEGTCNKCVIEIIDGQNNLSKRQDIETQLKNKFNLTDTERVACQVFVLDSITISTSYW